MVFSFAWTKSFWRGNETVLDVGARAGAWIFSSSCTAAVINAKHLEFVSLRWQSSVAARRIVFSVTCCSSSNSRCFRSLSSEFEGRQDTHDIRPLRQIITKITQDLPCTFDCVVNAKTFAFRLRSLLHAFAKARSLLHALAKATARVSKFSRMRTSFSLQSRPTTSPVATGGFCGVSHPKQSSKPPNWNIKHYKSLFLSNVSECHSPFEDFLTTRSIRTVGRRTPTA